MSDKKSVWETLSVLDVSSYTRKKNGMTYLSWAHAWKALKDSYPSATFNKHLQEDGMPYILDANGFAYVTVTVMAGGESATELFPVLDYRNKAIQNPDAFSINTAFQRGLAKAISYHGLGHYIYAGEDLPQSDGEARQEEVKQKPKPDPVKKQKAPAPAPTAADKPILGKMINTFAYKDADREPRAVSEWDTWSDVACSWIESARSEDMLKKFYVANQSMFGLAKTEATADYDKVINCISEKKIKLQKEKK